MQDVIIEVRRRQWPKEVKRRIVAEMFGPDVTVCEVARRHDIPPSQLFQWRKTLKDQIKMPEPTSFIPECTLRGRSAKT